ncbi:protein O-linked-mannose beta-1,2-N-acetylglucosaminyltransferase 1-like [Palaemon carinicauda]|uniref:protein O-linked-mannose beta-1,2-N-acetylglucosaminyltransferase 1-like n=1 Tax=Palaemon carinicauda TaxID=392227 RepID=UPI0035B6849C
MKLNKKYISSILIVIWFIDHSNSANFIREKSGREEYSVIDGSNFPKTLLSGRYGLSWNVRDRKRFPVDWRKIGEEWSLRPVNITAAERLHMAEKDTLKIRILIDIEKVQVFKDDMLIYEKRGNLSQFKFYTHAGFHVLILHPSTGHLMQARMFLTHQPAEHQNLAKNLHDILPGRLVVIAAVPDAVGFLGHGDALEALERLGATRIRQLALFEAWAMIAHAPHTETTTERHFYPLHETRSSYKKASKGRVWAEAITIHHRLEVRYPSPIDVQSYVPKGPIPRCPWHADPAMEDQRKFCEDYEGYARLCTCEDPINPRAFRYGAEKIAITEIIPVAMLTAIKPFNFYRQLLNLLETPGSAQTPIVVLVDGLQNEIVHLARLFGIDVLVHQPQGEKGSSTLLNMHFRFSVHNVFNFFPTVDKAIILEDDLLLSPDFLSFFQQTAWLLDADPTIYCINAFSINSYPDVAHDPTVLRRLEVFPQFGWMVNRKWAREQYKFWIPEQASGDWDWWLHAQDSRHGRDVLVPEISRTFHAGSAGAHVTGWAQESFFNHMIYNKDPLVKLRDLQSLTSTKYEQRIRKDILRAKELRVVGSPCEGSLLPQDQKGPFKIFMKADTREDEYGSFYVMHLCLHAYPEDTREQYRGVIRFNIHGQVLYIIGCPASPFCSMFPKGVEVLTPSEQLIAEAEAAASAWQQRHFNPYYLLRREATNPEEEFLMRNTLRNSFGKAKKYDE